MSVPGGTERIWLMRPAFCSPLELLKSVVSIWPKAGVWSDLKAAERPSASALEGAACHLVEVGVHIRSRCCCGAAGGILLQKVADLICPSHSWFSFC